MKRTLGTRIERIESCPCRFKSSLPPAVCHLTIFGKVLVGNDTEIGRLVILAPKDIGRGEDGV